MNSQAFDKDQTLIHTWKYHDREGKVIGCVNRFEDINGTKQIIPCFIPNQGGFKSGINLSPRPLFGLDKLKDHPKDKALSLGWSLSLSKPNKGLGLKLMPLLKPP